MRKLFGGVLLLTLMLNISCMNEEKVEKGFKPATPKVENGKLTPELLWSIGRVGGETVSPDGKQVLYSVTNFKIEDDKGYGDYYLMDIASKEITQITDTKENEGAMAWHPTSDKFTFISGASGSAQLWEMDLDGTNRKQISFLEEGISGYEISPDGSKVLFSIRVKVDDNIVNLHPDMPKATARIENDIMYRHWDSWHDYKYNHIFVADYNANGITSAKDILEGTQIDAPMLPFGGMEQIAWSPDGETIAYTCKKSVGKEYAFSTNSDIFLYNVAKGTEKNLTEGNMGYDQNPVFSDDGSMIAWESMARDGYEADQTRIMVYNFNTDEKINLSADTEQNAHGLVWSKDHQKIYFVTDYFATAQIFEVGLNDKTFKAVTEGVHNYQSVAIAADGLVAKRVSMSSPAELYLVDADTGSDEQLTQVTAPVMSQLTMGKVEKRWITTTDNKKMLTWVIYPPNFDPNKKYPTLLYCQGGPQSAVSQFWSYRWNFQLMAANDYIIVAPNRRGLPGFGMEWLEQISKDYSGQNIQDYFSAIDELAKEPFVDEDKLGAVGASYGGYSVYYLAGNHEKRFKTFISHCGIFNFDQMYATTEEMFFVDWEFGGAYWDKSNKVAQRTYANSPHNFVDKWDTPILVIHGAKDFRIPYTQGMGAYNSAVMKGVPAQFLYYPDENHWVLKPQNGIVWHRTYFSWLDQWLKEK